MKPPILVDFPESFETERLLLRSPLPGDGPEVYAAITESRDDLAPWMAWPKEHRTVDDSEAGARRARVAYLARSELRLHVYLKGTNTLAGIAGLQTIDWDVPKFEIGYWCRTGYTGRGYITEAVKAITSLAIDTLGAGRVEIRCDPRNRRSARVAERAGFQLEATLRNNDLGTNGTLRDTLVYSRLGGGG